MQFKFVEAKLHVMAFNLVYNAVYNAETGLQTKNLTVVRPNIPSKC